MKYHQPQGSKIMRAAGVPMIGRTVRLQQFVDMQTMGYDPTWDNWWGPERLRLSMYDVLLLHDVRLHLERRDWWPACDFDMSNARTCIWGIARRTRLWWNQDDDGDDFCWSKFYDAMSEWQRRSMRHLDDLLMVDDHTMSNTYAGRQKRVTREMAAAAIENYLINGQPDWRVIFKQRKVRW